MSKSRGAKLPWDTRAADVLAGRTKLDAGALIALVNEVNPTGRGRDARESAARYALKSRLQSLLVLRFPDQLEVAAEPDLPGVVSIRHRTHRHDACHAVLDTLDDEARSWVRFQLDVGAAPESEAPARPEPSAPDLESDDAPSSDPEEILRAAARAEEAFDYEQAQRLYTLAFQRSRDTSSALALLRFLVDVMAADTDALAIDHELPAAARAHPTVRVLLGLAAARSGDDARALDQVAHLEEPRAAETLALLARSALGRGDLDAAAQRLREAEAADPAHPDLRALAADLASREEAQRAPHEAELGLLVAEKKDTEARAKAEALLARWPASEPARRALRTLDARRQADEGRRLLAEGASARARGELAAALSLFQRALAVKLGDDDRAEAQRAIEQIRTEEKEREATKRADHAAALLGGASHDGAAVDVGRPKPRPPTEAERARGFGAYVELDEDVRRRVRARVSLDALGWLDAMIRAGVRAHAAVEAALAIERAATIEAADPAGALALLASHERAVDEVPAARSLVDRARRRIAEERRRRALEDLTAAEEALSAGDEERSHKLLDRAARELDEADARVAALRAQLAARAEWHRLQKRFDHARGRHQYSLARRVAEELGARVSGSERDRWIAAGRAVVEDARRDLRVQVMDMDAGAECSRRLFLGWYPPAVPAYVDLHEGVVILPSAAGREVFVRSFSLETGRLVRCVRLLAPERFGEPTLQIAGESMLLTGGIDGLLELSLGSAEPRRWSVFRDPKDPDRYFSHALLPAAQSRWLWVMHGGDMNEVSVVDLEGERLPRPLSDCDDFHPLWGASPARVAGISRGEGGILTVHEPAGARTDRVDFPTSVWSVAPHPAGEGFVMVRAPERLKPNDDTVLWSELSPRGQVLRTERLSGCRSYPQASMACARDPGMVFVRLKASDEIWHLVALQRDPAAGPTAPNLRVAYRLPIGSHRALVQDPEGRRVYLVGEDDRGIEIVPLGPEPPVLTERGRARKIEFPLHQLITCPKSHIDRPPLNLFVERFKWHSVEEIRQAYLELRAQRENDRAALVELFWGLSISDDLEGIVDLGVWLRERYPDDAEIRDMWWAALVAARRWVDLLAAIEPVDPASLSEASRQHRHHLLAVARVATGDVEAAARHLEDAVAAGGKCHLKPIQELLAALAEPLPVDEVPTDLPALRQLLAIVRAADARLDRGDAEGVIALYERSLPWQFDEVQSMARLAQAHLLRQARTDAERLQKAHALAVFAEAPNEERVGSRTELLIPWGTWSEERILDLVAKARAWLDAPGDG